MKRICITPGEPAGIGPDVVIQALQQAHSAQMIVIADPMMLEARAKQLRMPFHWTPYDKHQHVPHKPGHCTILPVEMPQASQPGRLATPNAPYVLNTLRAAHTLCSEGEADALITGPVHKSHLSTNGATFRGHTEFLSDLSNSCFVLMTFYHPELITALVTTHHPVEKVPGLITQEKILQSLELLIEQCQTLFHVPAPKVAVTGLNPHAGEDGLLGTEDQSIILPAIQKAQRLGHHVSGPLAADTLFCEPSRTHFDCILAMYHDQGLAPIKALYFNEIVNITLGLPYLRLSVDHGTALNIAGTGMSDAKSMHNAIKTACHLIKTPAVVLS